MSLPDGVHALTLTTERDGETVEYHPAAVETPRGLLLLDTGLPNLTDDLESALADAGFGFEDVTAVLLTHHDGDHAGGLAAARDRADDPVVYAHAAAVPFVDGRSRPIKMADDAERYPAVPVDVELQDGVVFRTEAGPMRAVFTPGHAPGHLALYFPESDFLLAGDALTAPEGELSGPSEVFTPDMAEATRSVGWLADLPVEQVHCYHGGTVNAGTADIERIHTSLRASLDEE